VVFVARAPQPLLQLRSSATSFTARRSDHGSCSHQQASPNQHQDGALPSRPLPICRAELPPHRATADVPSRRRREGMGGGTLGLGRGGGVRGGGADGSVRAICRCPQAGLRREGLPWLRPGGRHQGGIEPCPAASTGSSTITSPSRR
jgi:hypothetical protein